MATMANVCVRSLRNISSLSQVCLKRQLYVRVQQPRFWSTTATNTNGNPPSTEDTPETDKTAEIDTKQAELELKLRSIQEENISLKEEVKTIKEKYVRSLAETENVRKRMTKQIEDAKLFGIQGFCKDLLEVADILHLAIDNTPKDQIISNTHLKNLFEGLTMTESQLQKVFSKHGLEKIDPAVGEKFDPFVHEAMFQVPTQDKDSNSNVAVVNNVGYKLKDRTIRPANVGVFKA